MSTGNFENWAGTITDIGPMYPFVGTEMIWFIAGLVFWIWGIVLLHQYRNRLIACATQARETWAAPVSASV